MRAPSSYAEVLARAAAGELLGWWDMAVLFGYRHSRFHQLNRAGVFDRFKVERPIGARCFAGALVYRHIQGERTAPAAVPGPVPVFGRKRGTYGV